MTGLQRQEGEGQMDALKELPESGEMIAVVNPATGLAVSRIRREK